MASNTQRAFEGPAGTVAAKVMAVMNRAAEREAIETLRPASGDTVLVIGFGPGVGVELLAERLASGRVIGIDPSASMVREAARRNARFMHDGKVELHRASVERIPLPEASCDGGIAVNSAQLWDPLEVGVQELARVLRPTGRLVALTHTWAIGRTSEGTVEQWLELAANTLDRHGFDGIKHWRAAADRGTSVALTARRQ